MYKISTGVVCVNDKNPLPPIFNASILEITAFRFYDEYDYEDEIFWILSNQAREPALFLWENPIAVAILLRFLAYFSGRNVPNRNSRSISSTSSLMPQDFGAFFSANRTTLYD